MRTLRTILTLTTVPACLAYAEPPVSINWSIGPEMLQANAGGMTGIIGDDMIVAGGTFWHTMDSKRLVNWTQIYDIAEGKWRMGPDMPAERAYAFSVVIGDRMYVMGGCHQDMEPVADGLILSPVRGEEGVQYEWSPGPGLPLPANFMMGGAVGRTIYCTGGANGDLSETYNAVYSLNTANPDAGWQEFAEMPGPPTTILAATTCGGDLYAFGGYRVDRDPGENVDDAWKFDTNEGAWTRIRDLPFAGRAVTALAYDDRYIMIFGPYVQSAREAEIHGQDHGHSGAVLLYDTQRDRYEFLEPMPHSVVEIFFGLRGNTLYGAGGEWLYKIRSPFLFIGEVGPPADEE
ncbi:MAG: Kelch repeat-containing protein [Armatimonadota bacterium]